MKPGLENQHAEIRTERLRLVPFAEEFLTPRYVGWLNDPEVVRFSRQRHALHTLESCRRYWQSFHGTPHRLWAIVEAAEGLGHVGNLSASIDPHDEVADLGILIGQRSAWGRGYGSEAWKAVCRHLFEGPGVRKITAGTYATNLAMLGIMRAAGMAEDGRRLRHALVEGAEVDVVHAALFREGRR